MSDLTVATSTFQRAERIFVSVTGRITNFLCSSSTWKPGTGNELLKKVRSFCTTNTRHLGNRQFALKMNCNPNATGMDLLTPQLILRLRSNPAYIPLIEINEALNVVSTHDVLVNPNDDCRALIDDASLDCAIFYYEQENRAYISANCRRVAEINPINWTRAGAASSFNRQVEDYPESIKDHYRQEVKRASSLKHWKNTKKRILIGGKTEKIFHESLFAWLERELKNANCNVIKEPQKSNNDKMDIWIQEFGRFHVIEVKWMGKNEKTIYNADKIKLGLAQLQQYAENDPFPETSTLVVYDGRVRDEFDKLKGTLCEDGIAELLEHDGVVKPVSGICYVLFLYSGTASSAK